MAAVFQFAPGGILGEVRKTDLPAVYTAISAKIDTLAFDALWPGFKRCDFALYDDAQVVLGSDVFPKTDAFLANTAIRHQGRYVAIWRMAEETDADVLASKIVHEMFHAYQMERQDDRFPDETDALFRYEYRPDYLTLKFRENTFLADLCERFETDGYRKFLALRNARRASFPYQYRYECSVEAIEGSATYIEHRSLAALNEALYRKARRESLARIRDPRSLMPVRAVCYDVGAMLVHVCREQELPVNLSVGQTADDLLPGAALDGWESPPQSAANPEIAALYQDGVRAFRELIQSVTENNQPVAEGSFGLLGVNVYSARYLDGYIDTKHFVMYEDGKPVTLYGDFLLKMRGGRIAAIYPQP